jgi:signal transduction histidine kinase
MKKSWLGRVPFRLRVFFRGAFVALALAVVALAVRVLEEEKQRSYASYGDVFRETAQQIAARLRHPTGQLALLNPIAGDKTVTPIHPLVLPFSAIDFDDRAKARQAVEMTGCSVQYPGRGQICVAVGNAATAGAFLYVVGEFDSGPLTEHKIGDPDLAAAHRVLVDIDARGQTYRWVAALETASIRQSSGVHGRLTGFMVGEDGRMASRPDHEFRGWLWQDDRCTSDGGDEATCAKRTFYSLRVPVDAWRAELAPGPRPEWPPADLAKTRVHVAVLAPGSLVPVFDSNGSGATPPFSLAELRSQIHEGERLVITRLARDGSAHTVADLVGEDGERGNPPPLLTRLIRQLPVEGYDQPMKAAERISTPLGDYVVTLTGDVRALDRNLSLVASRLSWFVAAMLASIGLTWFAIEVRIIRRITLLTKRAAAVRRSVDAPQGPIHLDIEGLGGSDELGLLSGVLSDLMNRVNEDVKREQIRAVQEKDMWHAVGHEIKSPLQSLMALHADADDPSHRYIERMQQAVHVLYGSASPSEAILSASLSVGSLDVQSFLHHVALNADHAGLPGVIFEDNGGPVTVRGDEHSLEDVVTHILSNAARFRPPGTPIRISLQRQVKQALIVIHNEGPPIDPALGDRIFEYGVSGTAETAASGNRGQGLFVARTYMAKMGGTIEARNVAGGVEFVLSLALAA